jgi:predicted NBD/HSP70 family sugar kinase
VADSPVVLGLDFGGTKIAMAVCSPDGEQLAAVTVATDAAAGARACFDRGIRSARELLAAFAPGRELAAVGVATFGIPFDDHVDLAPNVGGWGDLPLGQELRAAFPGAAVRMATDAKAAALAESRWGALAGADPGIYLNLGTGLAVGIVVGGQVLQGRHGAAGEIGYNLRSVADVAAAAGPRPVLEEMVSGLGLARRAATLAGADGTARGRAGRTSAAADSAGAEDGAGPASSAAEPLTAAGVFAASEEDPALDGLVSEFVAELSYHVVNLAICLNPERIAVGGGMAGSWERLRPGLHDALRAGVPFPPELVPARFPSDAPLIGAVGLAVDAARDGGARNTFPALSLSEGLPL